MLFFAPRAKTETKVNVSITQQGKVAVTEDAHDDCCLGCKIDNFSKKSGSALMAPIRWIAGKAKSFSWDKINPC